MSPRTPISLLRSPRAAAFVKRGRGWNERWESIHITSSRETTKR
jgi:hypothetical protein